MILLFELSILRIVLSKSAEIVQLVLVVILSMVNKLFSSLIVAPLLHKI